MGNNAATRFRRHLLNGDEQAAMDLFLNSDELKMNFDPNSSYGDSFQHNTALHLVSQHAMLTFLRAFLYFQNGNPYKKNAFGKNALHLVCQGEDVQSSVVEDKLPAANDQLPTTENRRLACLRAILDWRSKTYADEIDIAAIDNDGNTALHYAAAAGRQDLAEALIAQDIPLLLENKCGETACDLAEKNGFHTIAELIEYTIVFSPKYNDPPVDASIQFSDGEVVNGLRSQDLQETKDQLLVETSDMLHVPLFTAEVLLRNYGWSRQSLLESWINNPVECCENAGISPPTSALQFTISSKGLKVSCEQVQEEYQNESLNSPAKSVSLETEIVCEICDFNIPLDSELVLVPCNHHFCRNCWKEYLTVKIQEGNAHNILCPAYLCHYLVPLDVIEKVVSQDMVKRYLHFDIKAFVETNPKIKWCPFPQCGHAVKLPDVEPLPQEVIQLTGATLTNVSHSVDCGNGHYFCWECLGEAHAPVNCEKWKEWFQKIADIKPQEMKNTYSKTEDAANWLWMATNSKPCPNCKSPIQKNEGCNHMKCMKCKYEYCWVCLESWKKHGTSTGGYFRCNRFEAAQKAEMRTGILISEAEAHNKQMQELKKFLHYFTKFRNHENCYKFEQTFLPIIQQKMVVLSSLYAESCSSASESVQFIEDALYELLRARRILCGSYVYGFYLEDNGYNKTIFEILQNELENSSEKLSEVIARTYLRNSRAKVITMTNVVKRRRVDFISAVLRGLIPPATPPSQRKKNRKRCPRLLGIDPIEEEQLSVLASLEDLDPNEPWVKDPQGRHTNLLTLYDWPYEDSDNDEDGGAAAASAVQDKASQNTCSRRGCSKQKARNCRTGALHEYCSLFCKYECERARGNSNENVIGIDPSMDMLIAIEMSKRQIENEMPEYVNRMDLYENTSNLFSGNEDSDEEKFSSSITVIRSDPRDDFSVRANSSNNNGADIKSDSKPVRNALKCAEAFCDMSCASTSSPVHAEASFSGQTHITQNNTKLDYFMKNSCNTIDIIYENINFKALENSKTEKELFADVEKSTKLLKNDQVNGSRCSL